MVDYIKSKSIKEYLKREAIELPDAHKAALILCSGYPIPMIHSSLQEIAEHTSDQSLKAAIQVKIRQQCQEIHTWKENNSNEVYGLEVYEPDEEAYIMEGIYRSYEAADLHAHYFEMEYIVRKYRLFGKDGLESHFHKRFGYIQAELGALHLDAEGNILKYIPGVGEMEAQQEKTMLDKPVILKHPFRKGDIVTDLETGDTGVVNDCESTLEEWVKQKEELAKCGDTENLGILIEYADPFGNFFERHTYPYHLEYAKEPRTGSASKARWQVLREAQKLIKGIGSLEKFTGCKAMLESKRRYW